MKITRSSEPALVDLARACFPEYTGRTFRVEVATTLHLRDYWSGGTRYYCRFVDLVTGRTVAADDLPRAAMQQQGNPYGLSMGEVALKPGVAAVEEIHFCGKNLGLRVTLHPENAAKLLPAACSAV